MDIHSGTGNGYVVQYTAHSGLTPSQVSNITINYVAHSTGAGLPDNTGSGAVYVLMSDGQWDNTHASYYISASDTTYTYSSTNVADYMGSDGSVGLLICFGGCSVANSFDVLTDLVQFQLTLSGSPAVADFSADQTAGVYPLTVNFTDTSSNTPTAWSWDFGDGGTDTVQNPSHTYAAAGNYTVALTASNSFGSNTCTIPNCIKTTLLASPVAVFSADTTSGNVPLAVTFTDDLHRFSNLLGLGLR